MDYKICENCRNWFYLKGQQGICYKHAYRMGAVAYYRVYNDATCDEFAPKKSIIMEEMMKCKCGFQFAGPGQFRNCEAFVTINGKSGVICPKCGTAYIDGKEVRLERGS